MPTPKPDGCSTGTCNSYLTTGKSGIQPRTCKSPTPHYTRFCKGKTYPAGSIVYDNCGFYFNEVDTSDDVSNANGDWIQFDQLTLLNKIFKGYSWDKFDCSMTYSKGEYVTRCGKLRISLKNGNTLTPEESDKLPEGERYWSKALSLPEFIESMVEYTLANTQIQHPVDDLKIEDIDIRRFRIKHKDNQGNTEEFFVQKPRDFRTICNPENRIQPGSVLRHAEANQAEAFNEQFDVRVVEDPELQNAPVDEWVNLPDVVFSYTNNLCSKAKVVANMRLGNLNALMLPGNWIRLELIGTEGVVNDPFADFDYRPYDPNFFNAMIPKSSTGGAGNHTFGTVQPGETVSFKVTPRYKLRSPYVSDPAAFVEFHTLKTTWLSVAI
jgi:hypothetical protein